jgi:hypothetical protein
MIQVEDANGFHTDYGVIPNLMMKWCCGKTERSDAALNALLDDE